jgi:hypothetical protein
MNTLWSVVFKVDSQCARWHAILGNIVLLWFLRMGAKEDRIDLNILH